MPRIMDLVAALLHPSSLGVAGGGFAVITGVHHAAFSHSWGGSAGLALRAAALVFEICIAAEMAFFVFFQAEHKRWLSSPCPVSLCLSTRRDPPDNTSNPLGFKNHSKPNYGRSWAPAFDVCVDLAHVSHQAQVSAPLSSGDHDKKRARHSLGEVFCPTAAGWGGRFEGRSDW